MSLLEELKEKRQDAIENVAAEDLDIEATNLTLAEHQRVRAFWVAQINDLDKAIAALSTETERGLLDPESPPVDDEVRNQADGAAPLLWCMHELAQDELYAAPSFEEAAAVADWANETFKQRDEDDPRMRFQIELWPYSAEAHAAGLVEWAKGWATKRNGDPIDWINNPPKAAPLAISGVKRTSDESQAEDPTIDAITAHIEAENAEPSIDTERTSESQSTDGIDRVEPAAFAPVNEDEGLMWANGFEADAKSKAEAEQDKRPFWTRAPKPKVNA